MQQEPTPLRNYVGVLKSIMPILLVYFFSYAGIYSVHDFVFKDLLNFTKSYNKIFLLNLCTTIKFFISGYVSTQADKKLNHHVFLCGGLGLYALSLIFFPIFSSYKKEIPEVLSNICLVLIVLIYFSSLGCFFAMIESLMMNFLIKKNLMKKYYLIKISGSVGHLIAFFPEYLFGSGSKFGILENVSSFVLKYSLGALYAIIAILIIFFNKIKYSLIEEKEPENQKNIENNSENQSIYKKILTLLTSSYILYLIPILFYGNLRVMNTCLLRDYQKEMNFDTSLSNEIAIIRIVLEMICYFTLGRFKKTEYIYYFFNFCLVGSLLRPALFLLIDKNDSENTKYYKVLVAEFSKAIVSSFFGYSSSRIALDLSPKGSETLAQGLSLGTQVGFSSVPFVIMALLIFNCYNPENTEEKNAFKIRYVFLTGIFFGILGFICSIFLTVKKNFKRSLN